MEEILECMNANPYSSECVGTVEYRMPLSATGIPYPRCDRHWDERMDIERGINQRYPSNEPDDFDPMYAGERWDEDY